MSMSLITSMASLRTTASVLVVIMMWDHRLLAVIMIMVAAVPGIIMFVIFMGMFVQDMWVIEQHQSYQHQQH